MPRARGIVPGKARKKKILRAAKGNFQGRRKLYRMAKETVMRGLYFAFRDRRQRKRLMRRLWIQRINAACRLNGMSYNRFIYGLDQAKIAINRKALSDLALHDAAAFARVVETAKKFAETTSK